MEPSLKKRFWDDATVVAVAGGFAVHLDGRSIKTPSKTNFLVPTERLAGLIAGEWQAQGDKVDPSTMPMTRRANAAIDKVAVQHQAVAEMLASYGGSDLLCYRAAHPLELQERQAEKWDPLLEWAAKQLAAPLNVTEGVMPISQPKDSLKNLSECVAHLAPFPLSGFHDLVTLSGSLVIGLAVIHDLGPAAELWAVSCVDEIWQEELWGEDSVATEAAARKRQEFLDAESFYRACL